MTKTIGQNIAEMEADLAACRAADMRIRLWKELFKQASEYEKKGMLTTVLDELLGFSEEEIKKILK